MIECITLDVVNIDNSDKVANLIKVRNFTRNTKKIEIFYLCLQLLQSF